MAKAKKNLLYTPHVSPIWVLLASLFWIALLHFVDTTRFADELETRVVKPFEYRLRETLERNPKLNPRVKIFGYDDKVISDTGRASLDLIQWARLLKAIDAQKPNAILIDAMFSLDEAAPADYDEAKKILATVSAPVIVGSFANRGDVRGREPLKLDSSDYALSRWFGKEKVERSDLGFLQSKELRRFNPNFVYGPTAKNRALFTHVGHFLYDGDSVFRPLLLSDSADLILPYFGLLSDPAARINNGKLVFHNNPMPIDNRGRVHLNFSSKADYFGREGRVRSLYKMLADTRKGSPIEGVAEGDYVVLIPFMFTGNTDFKMTPLGYVPGGLVHATVMSNALSGSWLRPIQGRTMIIVAACAVGALIGALNGPIAFAMLVLALEFLWFFACAYLYVFQNVVTSGHIPAIGFLLTAATVFTERMRVAEKKRQILKTALDGLVSPGNLKDIVKRPHAGLLEAREEVVTVMFIDVVGFSMISENQIPRLAFDSLKALINQLATMVHQHGGTVNKTLGDGLLCCFGKIFEDNPANNDHAVQALRCAIAIQKENLLRNVRAADSGESIYPLRIGVNTASVFLGDLGTGDRIDITVVGNGVNFAKRLEGACDMHSILMSKTTRDLLSVDVLEDTGLKRKLIHIKHHTELVEAFEYDPFFDQPELRLKATQLFRHYASLARVEDRWKLDDKDVVALKTNIGLGELIDFSSTGFRVKLPELMVRGSLIYIDIDATDPHMSAALREEKLQRIQAEVRWGYAEKDGNVHGVVFREMEPSRCDRLIKILRKAAIFAAMLCAGTGCVHNSRDLDPEPSFAYLSWDDVVHDRGVSDDQLGGAIEVLKVNSRLERLHPSIKQDAGLSKLVLDRYIDDSIPFDLGALGKLDHALYYVATKDKIVDSDRLYWVMIKTLSERYGCFMRQKFRSDEVFRFKCRDGRQVVFWRRETAESAEFYARQFDAAGHELVVKNHKVVSRKSFGMRDALAQPLFDEL